MDPSFAMTDLHDDEDRSSSLPSPEDIKMDLAMESRPMSNSDLSKGSDNTARSSEDSFVWNSDHDSSQLPSVEEARMNVDAPPRPSMSREKKKKCVLLLLATIVIVAIIVSVMFIVTKGGAEDEFESVPIKTETDGEFESAPVETTTNLRPTGTAVAPPTASPTPSPTVRAGTPSASPTTKAPTTAEPTVSRYNQILQILTSRGVSSAESLNTDGSPQNKALEWLAYADTDSLDEAVVKPENDADGVVQRYILALMYISMGGRTWRHKFNFMSDKSVCSWNALSSRKTYGVTCNQDGKVKTLAFPAKILVGTFPMELSKLTDLERLDVFNNKDLRGGFPAFLKDLPKLSFLGLHYCDLTGVFPSWLGEKTTLKSLILSNNEFQGALPENMAKLTLLEDLYLDDNQLQGGIEVLRNMKNLKKLILEDNQFTGSLDYDMVQNWRKLEVIDASHNRIESTIPTNFFTIPNLRIVDLHENRFFGPIPGFSNANTALEMLTLNNNNLDGEIPSILGDCTNLRHVDFTNNELTSTIPESLGNLANLEIFYLAQNKFSKGAIPSSFSNLKSLTQLSLKSTSRTGPIPSWMGGLSSLTLLDLDSNSLSDTIPSSLGNLKNLQYLLLNRNEVEGTIPSSLSKLSKLSFFVVDKNKLTGSAEAVCQLPDAQDMFAAADCRGTNPEVTCSCCNICCLDGDSACNDDVWLADSNPMWELGYERAVTVEFDAAASRSYTIQFTGQILP